MLLLGVVPGKSCRGFEPSLFATYNRQPESNAIIDPSGEKAGFPPSGFEIRTLGEPPEAGTAASWPDGAGVDNRTPVR
jgi:hypothetical protein